VKKVSDIRFAFEKGVRLFAADGHEELEKIAAHAPGSKVYIRLLVHNSQADWPLSRKFGCDHETALELMSLARDLGLRPVGLSFHVGSQTRHASMWGPVLHAVSQTWFAAKEAGFDLTLLNIGGGFPAYYGDAVQHVSEYAPEVRAQIQEIFGDIPDLMAEPGRGLVATSGALACEVLLVSKKAASDLHRWVYLDVGRFSGLAETEGEAVRYQFLTPYGEGVAKGPSIMAGPSCDSADVLYEKRPVMLPLDLKAGDQMVVRNAGSYTTTYSSVGFNGFPPLAVVVI
jgi:ornithine decarboxylase